MFNQAPFNQQPFNRPLSLEIFASMLLEGEGEFELLAGRTTVAKLTLNGEGELILSTGKTTNAGLLANGEGGTVFNFGKLRLANMLFDGQGAMIINNESFTILIMEYFGQVAPNDRIIINTEKFTVTKNNINDLENFDGNFIDLKEGTNELRFEDSEISRTVIIRIEHKDRFV